MSSRDCKRRARMRPPLLTAVTIREEGMFDAMKGAELPEAALGPPSSRAEALPPADEEGAILPI